MSLPFPNFFLKHLVHGAPSKRLKEDTRSQTDFIIDNQIDFFFFFCIFIWWQFFLDYRNGVATFLWASPLLSLRYISSRVVSICIQHYYMILYCVVQVACPSILAGHRPVIAVATSTAGSVLYFSEGTMASLANSLANSLTQRQQRTHSDSWHANMWEQKQRLPALVPVSSFLFFFCFLYHVFTEFLSVGKTNLPSTPITFRETR